MDDSRYLGPHQTSPPVMVRLVPSEWQLAFDCQGLSESRVSSELECHSVPLCRSIIYHSPPQFGPGGVPAAFTRRSTLASAQFNFPNVFNFPTFSSLIGSPPLYTSTCSDRDSDNNSAHGMSAIDTASTLESLQFLIDPSLRHLIPGDTTGGIDASGSLLGSHLTSDVPIDPSLFDLERVVNDARTGKLSSQPPGPDDGMIAPINPHTQPIGVEHTVHSQLDTGHIEPQPQQETADIEAQGEDEEIDPALREIVNSLTNAQQVSSVPINRKTWL